MIAVGQIQLAPVHVNKVLLEHSHAHLSAYCSGCFCTTMAELSSCQRPHGPQSQKCFLAGSSQEKSAHPLDHQEEELRSCAELLKYKLTSQRQMTTGDNLLDSSKAKGAVESTAAHLAVFWVSQHSVQTFHLHLDALPSPKGSVSPNAVPKWNLCFK